MDFKNYIGEYNSLAELQNDINENILNKPYVALVGSGDSKYVDYNSLSELDFLSFEIVSAGTLAFTNSLLNPEIKVNGGQWVPYDENTHASVIYSVGDIIKLRAEECAGTQIIDYSTSMYRVYGNVNSLFYDWTITSGAHQFTMLFYGCTGLTDASGLILPATDLYGTGLTHTYDSMFYQCENLTGAPALPATGLSEACYANMFYGCRSLATAPALPATTLAAGCYESMFYGCESLVESPILSANSTSTQSYKNMFANCTGMTAVTCLATNISAYECVQGMCDGVAMQGVFIKNPAMSGWTYNYSGNDGGIPADWRVADYPNTVEYVRFVGVLADSVQAQNPNIYFDLEFPVTEYYLQINYSENNSSSGITYQGPLKYFQVIARGVPVTIKEVDYQYTEKCNGDGYCEGWDVVASEHRDEVIESTYVGDTGGTDEFDSIMFSVDTGGLSYGYGPLFINVANYEQISYVQCACDVCGECPDPCEECSDPQSSQECCECQGGTWTGESSEPCVFE